MLGKFSLPSWLYILRKIKRRVLILIKNRLWIFFAKIVRDEMIIIIYFRIEYRIL